MPDVDFHVAGVRADAYAAEPLLVFQLHVRQADAHLAIHAIALRCQIRIEPQRRRYTAAQKDALLELFGAADGWGRTLHPLLWTHASLMVPAFEGETRADLPVPCSFDFSLAATKYFDALGDDGDIPLCFLFSGTIFYQTAESPLQAAPISWSKESDFRLPAAVWRELMQRHYPDTAFLPVNKALFDRLRRFRVLAGHLTWDRALEDLLAAAEPKAAEASA